MKHQIMTVMLDAFLIINALPPKFLQKRFPRTFSMVHLLHRLYGVDAPADEYASITNFRISVGFSSQSKKTSLYPPYLNFKTASTIAYIVHSKLDYCNSLYYLPKSQTNRLQVIQNFLAGLWLRLPNSVTSPLFFNLYIGLKSTNALNINFFLLPIKLLPLFNLLICTACSSAPRATRSSSVVTLSRPPTSSSLKITNRSFRYASAHLWNQLPVSFRQPCTKHPADDVTLSNSPPIYSPLSRTSTTHSLFRSRLKTHRFHKSFPP